MKQNSIVCSLCVTLVILFIFSPSIQAQPYVDVLNIKYQYFPSTRYVKASKNTLATSHTEASILFPVERKNKDVILAGGDYTQLSFSASGAVDAHTTLYSTALYLGYDRQWKNEHWRNTILLIPKFNTDFDKGISNSFQLGGILLFNYIKKENLKYHFGLYYNREFFGHYFMPLVGIDWNINQKLNLFGDLPNNLVLEYKLGTSFYTGFSFLSTVSSYRIVSSLAPGGYVREGDNFFGHDQIKLFVNWYIIPWLVLYAEGGQTLFRYYLLYDKNDHLIDTHAVFNKTKDELFFNVGLAYRVRLD
jgi:hypothetical protein